MFIICVMRASEFPLSKSEMYVFICCAEHTVSKEENPTYSSCLLSLYAMDHNLLMFDPIPDSDNLHYMNFLFFFFFKDIQLAKILHVRKNTHCLLNIKYLSQV